MAMPSVEKLLDIGIALSSEKNSDKLLETILDAAMDISDCDGGTLYVLEDNALHYKIMITKSLGIRFGMDKKIELPPVALMRSNVSGCAVLDKKPINLADIYESQGFNFTGPKEFDARTGYKTSSMLSVPMEDEYGDVIGVMQLINAQANYLDSHQANYQDSSGHADQPKKVKTVPFTPECERVIFSLASQAAICLTSRQHAREVADLLDCFVKVMSTAIDARSPYNANHTRNMAKYALKFVEWLRANGLAAFDEAREKQFLMSVWLHDIGKLVVPLEVMDKQSRLGAKLDRVMARFRMIGLQLEIDFLQEAAISGSDEAERKKRHAERHAERRAELCAARELVEFADRAGFLPDEKLAAIRALGAATANGPDGPTPYLLDDELNCLLVRKGTLTDEERKIMESHVTMTRRMLCEMNFPKRYQLIPAWASSHHEYLNGSGYPDRLTADEIPTEVRALTILDIYDALTARDRPYKPAMPIEKAFAIMDDMAKGGQLDATLWDQFKMSEAWKEI